MFHTEHRCFSRLDDAWRAEFGDDVERPRLAELLRSGVAIFDLDYDAILSAMYALSFSAEGDCYRCVPPDPDIAVAALGASASGTPPDPAPAEALHTLTLDSGASRCFFRDSTTLTPLPAPVPVRQADPSGGPDVVSSSTVLPCPAVPSGSLSRLHLPSFSTNLGRVCTHWLPSLLRSLHLLRCPRQRAAPHSSSFPLTTAPLQTLHMDVWGPARVSGQGRECYFLLVVDDYTRYTMVFPLRSKGEVVDVLIPGIRSICLHLREHFDTDLPVLHLHSDRGGSAHQLNLWLRVSLPETSPTLRWTGKVGDASVFPVWGFRAFVRDTSADKLSARAIPCVFLDITFDKSVPFYRLFPYRSAPPPPPPLILAPGPPPVDPLPPQGPAPLGVSQIDPLPGTAPVQVAVSSGAAPGAASGGAASGGAEPGGAGSEGAGSWGAEPGGAEPEGVEPGGAESEGAESGGAAPRGATSSGGPAGAAVTTGAGGTGGTVATGPGGARTSGAGAAGTGGIWCAGAGDPTEPGAVGAGGAGAGGAGVGGPGAGGPGAAGDGAVDPGAGGAGGTVRPRPYFVQLLQHVLGVPSSTSLHPPFLCPLPDQSQPPLQPASPLPAPSPYTEQSGGLTERHEPASRPISPVRTARRTPRLRPPPVPGTHAITLGPSSVPLRVPLPTPPDSSLPEVPDPASDRARAASPTVSLLLASAVTDPSFESAAASTLVAELLDFAADCCLDYATALVAESVSASPPSVGGECALSTDVLEHRQEDFECLAAAVPRFASMLLAPEGDLDAPDIPTPRSYAEAIEGPYSSQWQAAMDAKMASWKSTGTYVDEVPPSRANIVDGM
ncbi:unnamed protein product [Closterium sp. NIES-53]